MTQLTVSIEDPSMLSDIRKAIKMIRGVVSVKTEKNKPNATTLAAIKEAENGEGVFCDSFDEYLKIVSESDNV